MNELDFEVKTSPVFYLDQNGDYTLSDKHKALVHSKSNEALSIMSDSYNPLSIMDFKEISNKLQKVSGFELEKQQVWKGGKVVLSYLKNNQDVKTIAGFPTSNYLVFGTSYNGTSQTFLGSSSILLRCLNQFSKISRSNKIRHTMSADVKINELVSSIEEYFIETNNMYKEFDIWNDKKIYADTVEYAIRTMLELEEVEENSTRKLNKAELIKSCMQIETNAIGDSLNGLFQGFTRFSSHHMNPNSTSYGAICGSNKAFNDRAYKIVKELELSL